jgi:hypothetical protein
MERYSEFSLVDFYASGTSRGRAIVTWRYVSNKGEKYPVLVGELPGK